MKAIKIMLVILVVGCSEAIIKDELTLNDINVLTEGDRNAYNFWAEYSIKLCRDIKTTSDSVCGGYFVYESTYTLLNDNYNNALEKIDYAYDCFIHEYEYGYQITSNEIILNVYDSLRLRHYDVHALIDPYLNALETIKTRIK